MQFAKISISRQTVTCCICELATCDDEPTPGCPKSLHKERFPFPEPSFSNLQGPQQRSPPPPPGSPKWSSHRERDALSVEPPFNYLSEFAVNRHIRLLSPPSLKVLGEWTHPSSVPSSLCLSESQKTLYFGFPGERSPP